MKGIFRSFPGFIAAFMLGAYFKDPSTAQATTTVKETTVGFIIGAAIIACLFLCAITRGKKQDQQSGGFARARTGRN